MYTQGQIIWPRPLVDWRGSLQQRPSTTDDDDQQQLEAMGLFLYGIHHPLRPSQQRKIIQELDKNPRLVLRLGLTPDRLALIMKTNSSLASQILQHLVSFRAFRDYLEFVSNLQLDLPAVEMIHGLAPHLESSIVYRFISRCITDIEREKDAGSQTRKALLLCKLIQSLLKSNLLTGINIEIEAFCIQFSRIREVAELYSNLRNVSS
jgi:hypothetical protein